MALEEAVEDCLGVRRHFAAGDRHRVAEQGHPRAQQLLEGFFEDRVVVVVLHIPQQIHVHTGTSTEEVHMKYSYCIFQRSSTRKAAAETGELREQLCEDILG